LRILEEIPAYKTEKFFLAILLFDPSAFLPNGALGLHNFVNDSMAFQKDWAHHSWFSVIQEALQNVEKMFSVLFGSHWEGCMADTVSRIIVHKHPERGGFVWQAISVMLNQFFIEMSDRESRFKEEFTIGCRSDKTDPHLVVLYLRWYMDLAMESLTEKAFHHYRLDVATRSPESSGFIFSTPVNPRWDMSKKRAFPQGTSATGSATFRRRPEESKRDNDDDGVSVVGTMKQKGRFNSGTRGVCLADYLYEEGIKLSFVTTDKPKPCKHGPECHFLHKKDWSKLPNGVLYKSLASIRAFENKPEDLEVIRKKLGA
jgi:hypothetical protein